MAAIVFILYLRQKQLGHDYSTREILMGEIVVVCFVPFIPLLPLAFYLIDVVCADVANWNSPYKVDCWWPRS